MTAAVAIRDRMTSARAGETAGDRLALGVGERWYVAMTAPRKERIAEINLANQGFRAFLPRQLATRRHADKFRTALAPVFPRYLFVIVDLERARWRSVNGTIGVQRLIADAERPIAVAPGVVETSDPIVRRRAARWSFGPMSSPSAIASACNPGRSPDRSASCSGSTAPAACSFCSSCSAVRSSCRSSERASSRSTSGDERRRGVEIGGRLGRFTAMAVAWPRGFELGRVRRVGFIDMRSAARAAARMDALIVRRRGRREQT